MNKYFVILFISFFLFTGCNKSETNVISNENESATEEVTSQTESLSEGKTNSDYDSSITDKSFMWSEPLLDLEQMFQENNYTALKDIVNMDGSIEIEQINIPSEINGTPIHSFAYLYGNNCVVSLKNEEKEVGIYNYVDNSYKKLFSVGDLIASDDSIHAYEFNNGNILFRSSAAGMGTFCDGKLWLYNMNMAQLELIYQYNTMEDGYTNIFGGQTQILTDSGVYFSDCYYNDEISEYVSNLYFYDFNNKANSLIREYAVLPIKYKDSYACFIKDETTDYKTLIDFEGNVLWKVDEYYSEIISNGTQIYILPYAFDHEKTTAKIGVADLNKDYIFTSYSSGGFNHITEKYLMCEMVYLNPGFPFIYDIQSDKLVVLNMLPETSYFYFMKVLGDDSQVVIKIEEDNYLLKFSEQIQ